MLPGPNIVGLGNAGNEVPRWPFVLNEDSPQAVGLVGWWPAIFDTGDGRFRDLSGTREAGDATGTTTPGLVAVDNDGLAPKFTTSTDMSSGPLASLDGGTVITASCWSVGTSLVTNSGALAIRTGTTGDKLLLLYPFDSLTTGGFRVWFGNNSVINDNGSSKADGKPHLFLFTQRANVDREGFVDGISVGTNSLPITVSSATAVDFGHWNNSQHLQVPAWDFRVYNRAMDADEVWGLYDPETRWDLAYELGRRTYFFPAAPIGGGNEGAAMYHHLQNLGVY